MARVANDIYELSIHFLSENHMRYLKVKKYFDCENVM